MHFLLQSLAKLGNNQSFLFIFYFFNKLHFIKPNKATTMQRRLISLDSVAKKVTQPTVPTTLRNFANSKTKNQSSAQNKVILLTKDFIPAASSPAKLLVDFRPLELSNPRK